MTIHLPEELESPIRAAVDDGRFASADDMVAVVVREYLRLGRQDLGAPDPGGQPLTADKPIWQVIEEENRSIPTEVWEALPTDLAGQHAQSINGTSLRKGQDEPRETDAGEGVLDPAPKPIWEKILEMTADVPDEVWDSLPTDLAEQHDHYIYGTPKRPTA